MRTLMQIRRSGGEVIVINPLKEVGLVNFSVPSDVRSLLFGSKIASLYVQPHIGGDIALLDRRRQARARTRTRSNAAFIAQADRGIRRLSRSRSKQLSGSTIEQGSAASTGRRSSRSPSCMLAAKNVVFGWTMGITHHAHGVANVRMIVNLALLRGMVGRPGAGLLPIRGHCNVQGIGSVGVTPKLKQAILDRLESLLNVKLPTQPGLDTMACMQAADRGE